MKYLLLFLLSWSSLAAVEYDQYARLLETYVEDSGVDYDGWFENKDDLAALDAVVDHFAEVDVAKLDRDAQEAFYINLYNAAMLQIVFENYPVESVTEIGANPFDVFKDKFIKQGDRVLSLDDVEKGILLVDYFDPRIHFAVNCASESCPPLRTEPFTGEQLEAQLEEQTCLFAESSRAARVSDRSKRTVYSELFNWYDKDFEGDNPAGYLNRYRDEPLPLDYETGWIKYDWALNIAN